jgi:uncharacterized protein with HEPN domain
MQRDARTYLFDIQQASALIVEFTVGRNLDDYLTDVMLRSAVERQFEIIGEAMTQLSKLNAALAERISEHRRIIAFRNILIHAYGQIDDETVWDTVQTKLSILRREVDELLAEPRAGCRGRAGSG